LSSSSPNTNKGKKTKTGKLKKRKRKVLCFITRKHKPGSRIIENYTKLISWNGDESDQIIGGSA